MLRGKNDDLKIGERLIRRMNDKMPFSKVFRMAFDETKCLPVCYFAAAYSKNREWK